MLKIRHIAKKAFLILLKTCFIIKMKYVKFINTLWPAMLALNRVLFITVYLLADRKQKTQYLIVLHTSVTISSGI